VGLTPEPAPVARREFVLAFGGAENDEKLGRIKGRYDPDNLFQINYNIRPIAG
jgi:FAD/FMN-containing dehydrogenase